MGLSESEKKVLEELERGLYADDSAFQRKSKASIERIESPGTNSPAKVIAGTLVAVAGISVLVFGAIAQIAPFGVLGFLVMLLGILVASASGSSSAKPASGKIPSHSPKQTRGSKFEERWNRRTEQ
jgi:hypothetical protein